MEKNISQTSIRYHRGSPFPWMWKCSLTSNQTIILIVIVMVSSLSLSLSDLINRLYKLVQPRIILSCTNLVFIHGYSSQDTLHTTEIVNI